MQSRTTTTVMLGLAQRLAWASSYYLPAVLASAIGKDVCTSTATIFAAFSLALLVAEAVGPYAGRWIDRLGGRPVLMASNLVFAAGLAALSQAHQASHVFAAWAVMGLAMGSGLYEAAFATVVRLHRQDALRAITGITLFAVFASTVGWPLSAYLESTVGWRGACLAWAGIHLLIIGLPLNALLPSALRVQLAPRTAALAQETGAGLSSALQRRAAILMAFIFAVTWFISTAMAAHLPALVQSTGATLAVAVGIAALVGPAQVAGQLIEFTFPQARASAAICTLCHACAPGRRAVHRMVWQLGGHRFCIPAWAGKWHSDHCHWDAAAAGLRCQGLWTAPGPPYGACPHRAGWRALRFWAGSAAVGGRRAVVFSHPGHLRVSRGGCHGGRHESDCAPIQAQ